MQHCKRLVSLLILVLITAQLLAQTEPDITGLWKGTMYNDTTKQFLKYEIAISEKKGKLYGFTHTYFIVDDKEYHGVKKVKIKKKDGKIIIEDAELIVHNYPIPPAKGIRQLNVLSLENSEGVMTLSGPFSTNRTKEYRSLTGNINVQRKTNFRQSALIPHLGELGLAEELSFVEEERLKEISGTVASGNEAVKKAATEKAAVKEATKKTTQQDPVIVKTAEPKAAALPKPVTVKTEGSKTMQQDQAKVKIEATKKTTQQDPVIVKTAEPKAASPEPVTVKTEGSKTMQQEQAKTKTEETKTASIKPAQAAVNISSRVIETIQSVNYTSDSLVLTLYDNGEIDGDTVSVLLNGEVVMPKVGLSTNAVRKTIYTKDLPDTIQLVMYAETLGSLPPNTGLLIVYDGTERYEIRFSGDLKKNAAIVFRRKER